MTSHDESSSEAIFAVGLVAALFSVMSISRSVRSADSFGKSKALCKLSGETLLVMVVGSRHSSGMRASLAAPSSEPDLVNLLEALWQNSGKGSFSAGAGSSLVTVACCSLNVVRICMVLCWALDRRHQDQNTPRTRLLLDRPTFRITEIQLMTSCYLH